MAKVRGVRFTEQEESLIEEFIRQNPFFDFSTLAKIAILKFINSPKIEFKPVKEKSFLESSEVSHVNN